MVISGYGWERACAEPNNRPEFKLVDGFGLVDKKLTLRRFTRVWWRYEKPDDKEPKMIIHNPEKPVTTGGYIRPEYYSMQILEYGFRRRELWIPANNSAS